MSLSIIKLINVSFSRIPLVLVSQLIDVCHWPQGGLGK